MKCSHLLFKLKEIKNDKKTLPETLIKRLTNISHAKYMLIYYKKKTNEFIIGAFRVIDPKMSTLINIVLFFY